MKKQERKILEEYFNIYECDDNTIELENWTNKGVDMIIYIQDTKNIINELENYIDNFDIDEEIDLYRQDESYKEAFTIRESLEDFEDWIQTVENCIKELRGLK